MRIFRSYRLIGLPAQEDRGREWIFLRAPAAGGAASIATPDSSMIRQPAGPDSGTNGLGAPRRRLNPGVEA
jgi:hypothetical protein